MNNKKLYRSTSDKMLTGLCGGIADYLNIDSTLVRIGFVILEFATAGLLIIGYFILALIVPKQPSKSESAPPTAPSPK